MFAALLDTCVLWPSLQRDFLLSLAVEGIYRPLWSSAVLEELELHEAEKLVKRGIAGPAEAERRAHRLIERMRVSFDDAEVIGWEPLEGTFGLPDEDDEHVLAAAVVGGAGAIVTANLRHFPGSLMPRHLQVLPPAEFAHNTVSVDPVAALRAVHEVATRRQQSDDPLTPELVLERLERIYDLGKAVAVLRDSLQSP